ncbi:LTXXQ motif protein [Synechocystis sp. PCC 7509]|uniref:LTXXQ motif protein n=1 Tax=Synechocystis sp. PCC 7509 TaxID=927677 RepID=UPI0002AC14C3|nr:LTXXQ motif protein [Synechocystis sp. PCC 7509]
MKINRLLIVSAMSILIGGGGFIASKAIAQNAAPPTEQRQPGERMRGGGKFERLSGITEAQKTQLQQIKSASRQQIEAIPSNEQKARMAAIRNDARTKMAAILTAEQRQQLAQSPANSEGKGRGMPKISGLTDAQKTQMRAIRTATRQQMEAVLTAEQKAQIEAIRNDTKTKMDAVLTASQRQELEQMRQQKQQNRQQRQS